MAELGKVLVLSASAGAGHLRAAQAVERALTGMGAVREVRHIDVLEYTNKLFRHFYSKAYIEMVNTMPDVLGWLYDHSTNHGRTSGAGWRSTNSIRGPS